MIKVVTVEIDLSQLVGTMINGVEIHAKDIVRALGNSVRKDIMQQASAGLKTSKSDYKRSVSNVRVRGKGDVAIATITLEGSLANMIEDGADPYDMHETILRRFAPGRKVSKKGDLYTVVPFTHKRPGTQGRTPMGMQYNAKVVDVHSIGEKAYSYAKEVGNKPGQASSMSYGLFPKIHGQPRQVGPYQADAHSHDPFGGMRREPMKKGKGTELKSFRTISDGVPNKWYHPGIQARQVFDKAEAKVYSSFSETVQEFMQGMGKGLKK